MVAMDYASRTGRRDDLVESLRQSQADRAELGETGRAADAEHAADVLESGGDAAYFDRVIYAVGDPDRSTTYSGTRDWVAAQLREHVEGWEHQGKPQLAAQAREVLAQLAQGAESVRVGHLVYEVRD